MQSLRQRRDAQSGGRKPAAHSHTPSLQEPAAAPEPVAEPTFAPAPAEQIEATPYDEALEDLAAAGLGYTEAVAILDAITSGKIRHVKAWLG